MMLQLIVKSPLKRRVLILFFPLWLASGFSSSSPGDGGRGKQTNPRIVGGEDVAKDKFQFLATVSIYNRDVSIQSKVLLTCTGSLLTPKWVVSAAHCFGKKKKLNVDRCVEGNVCKENRFGDFTYLPKKIKSYVQINVANFFTDYRFNKNYEVKRVVRPEAAYPGGGYGDYGGFDIVLIELKEKVEDASPICLPTPDYKDDNLEHATISGYGKNRRATCQVNSKGPTKFRYCGIEKECQSRTSDKYREAACRVEFEYGGKTRYGCIKNETTPVMKSKECRKFIGSMKGEFEKWEDTDDFIILDATSLKLLAKCYRFEDEKHGWCATNMVASLKNQKFKIQSDYGWGFCSKECTRDLSTSIFGIAREKTIQVLRHDYCLNRMTKGGTFKFKHTPQVLCVAENFTYNQRIYLKDKKGKYTYIGVADNKGRSAKLKKWRKKENQRYIVGPGSCHGDSGGPLFKTVMSPDKGLIKVLLGVTSSGTAQIGHCGGIDNPTHYTRLKKMLSWIQRYIKSGLCYVDNDGRVQRGHPKLRKGGGKKYRRWRRRRNKAAKKKKKGKRRRQKSFRIRMDTPRDKTASEDYSNDAWDPSRSGTHGQGKEKITYFKSNYPVGR